MTTKTARTTERMSMIPDRSGIGLGSGTRFESGLELGYRAVGDSELMLLLLSKLSKSENGELVNRLCKEKGQK